MICWRQFNSLCLHLPFSDEGANQGTHLFEIHSLQQGGSETHSMSRETATHEAQSFLGLEYENCMAIKATYTCQGKTEILVVVPPLAQESQNVLHLKETTLIMVQWKIETLTMR